MPGDRQVGVTEIADEETAVGIHALVHIAEIYIVQSRRDRLDTRIERHTTYVGEIDSHTVETAESINKSTTPIASRHRVGHKHSAVGGAGRVRRIAITGAVADDVSGIV